MVVCRSRAPTQGYETDEHEFRGKQVKNNHSAYSSITKTEYGLSEYLTLRFPSNSRAAAAEFNMRVGVLNSFKKVTSPSGAFK